MLQFISLPLKIELISDTNAQLMENSITSYHKNQETMRKKMRKEKENNRSRLKEKGAKTVLQSVLQRFFAKLNGSMKLLQSEHLRTIFELFCLQNSLIVGVQPQVSGKVGSLVGCFLGGQCSAFPTTVEFYRKASCRGRNKNADENARKILLLKRHHEGVLISFA